MWMQHALPDHVLLQLDFRNAFNSFKRKALLQAVADYCPWFLPYALACYSREGALFADGGFTVASAEGVHQGDPCGPLFFALQSWPCPNSSVLCRAADPNGIWTTATWLAHVPSSTICCPSWKRRPPSWAWSLTGPNVQSSSHPPD